MRKVGARPATKKFSRCSGDSSRVLYFQNKTAPFGAVFYGAQGGIRTPEGIKPTGLQPVPFDHFGTYAFFCKQCS